MFTHTCACCGRAFESTSSRRRFCGHTCANRHRSEGATQWATYRCADCGAEVTTKPRYVGKYRYCETCRETRYADHLRHNRNRKPAVTIVCQHCGRPFNVLACFARRKYCSRACGAAAKVGKPHPKPRPAMPREERLQRYRRRAASYRKRKHAEWDALPKVPCACGCGRLISPIGRLGKPVRYALGHGPHNHVFPKGHTTWNKGIRGPASHSWQGGTGALPYGPGFTKALKRAILERDGYTCRRCGKTQAQNDRALQVHHIDHDKSNNDPSNLAAVCNKCNIWCSFHRNEPFIPLTPPAP